MKLKKLLKNIPVISIKGSKDVEITGVSANSKLVSPGNLFIARRGRAADGHRYIPEALAAGATAVVADIFDPSLRDVVQVIHPDIVAAEGAIAAEYYQHPSSELFLVGITGTNGKTTSSFLVKYLLDQLSMRCGLIGTIEYLIGQHRYQATRTTPDVCSNHKMLREMVLQGCDAAVMEVTSHALDQQRVAHVEYDVALFTNLTLEHLDYHKTMELYCEAKSLLFRSLGGKEAKKRRPKWAISNADSPWHHKMIEGCTAKIMTYGISVEADLKASNIALTPSGTTFEVTYQGETVPCCTPLVGRYNVYNCLGAIAVALTRGESLKKVCPLLSGFAIVPGRLEAVPNCLNLKIYVDFAHSDDALTNVLECLQEFKRGRIITVFGCGGDRDQTKRPKMARAAEMYSDQIIVTTDNPRSEDPATICQQIVAGFTQQVSYVVELDRREAIRKAIEMATPDDLILIAGKGHETSQIFAHKIIEFDDRKVAIQLCQQHGACV